MARLQLKSTKLESQQTELTKRLQTLDQETNELNLQKEQQSNALAIELQLLYKLPNEDVIKMILNQQDLSERVRFSHYYQAMQKTRLNTITEYQMTLDKIAEKARKTATLQQEIKQTQQDLSKSQSDLKKAQQKRTQALTAIKKDQSQQARQLTRLETERQSLLKLLAKWKQSRAQHGTITGAGKKGDLHWPIKGKILHAFGSTHTTGNRLWKGIFIRAKFGDPVKATHSGEVIFANWLRGYGLLCIIEHEKGLLSLYGHNSALRVEIGQKVNF